MDQVKLENLQLEVIWLYEKYMFKVKLQFIKDFLEQELVDLQVHNLGHMDSANPIQGLVEGASQTPKMLKLLEVILEAAV